MEFFLKRILWAVHTIFQFTTIVTAQINITPVGSENVIVGLHHHTQTCATSNMKESHLEGRGVTQMITKDYSSDAESFPETFPSH